MTETSLKGIPILIVDDLDDIRDLLQELLELRGYQTVLQASNGAEALETLKTQPGIGTILLDLMMPDMDGYEVCRRVSGTLRTSHIPIIVVTGGAARRDDALTKSFECGATDFLHKPVNEIELFARVTAALMLFTERVENRRKTRALQESQERYELAISGVNDGVWDINFETQKAYYAPKWKEMLGYPDDELPNQMGMWEELLHPEDRERVLRAIHEHWDMKTPYYTSEHRLKTKSGGYIWVFSRGRAVWDENGNVRRMAGSTTDITERLELQRQASEAQRARTLERIAAKFAKEIENRLKAIDQAVEDAPDALRSRVHQSARDTQQLCQKLATVAGTATGRQDPVDLLTLVRNLIHGPDLPPHRKVIIELTADSKPLTVRGDPEQIRLAILDLLSNSLEALGSSLGNVELAVRQATLTEGELASAAARAPSTPGTVFATVTIKDNGPGFAPEIQDQALEPFTTTKQGHSGIGLAHAAAVAIAHEGALFIDSKPEGGATVTLTLAANMQVPPARIPNPPSTGSVATMPDDARPAPTKPPRERPVILVIEDEVGIQDVISALLQELGFDVDVASDGQSGIRRYSERLPDIVAVIVDQCMPDLGGIEVFERLREINPDAKVILTSGYHERAGAEDLMKRGLAGFLQKPFRFENLRETVRSVIGKDS